ncbi:hypothetical protein BH09PSE5_BH09PSE5_21940 [soil metagenome]
MTTGHAAPLEVAASRWQSDQLRLLADNVPALIAYYEADNFSCEFANKGYAQTFGLDEVSIVGRHVAAIIGDEAMAEIQPYIDQMQSENVAIRYERKLVTGSNGTPQWLEVHLLPHLGADAIAIGCFVLITDISRHRLAEQAVRESQERLTRFMQASEEGIVFHKDGIITDANPPVCRVTGYSMEQLVGMKAMQFVAPGYVAGAAARVASGEDAAHESVLVDKNGEYVPVEFIGRTLTLNGESYRMTIVRDLRDRRAAQARIHHLAHHDALTGLPNRMSFMEHLEHGMRLANDTGEPLALLFIDLDDFKRVNDSLGHLAGDKLLQAVAARITDALRSTDRVARFGGDEFMVMLPNALHRPDIEDVSRKLLAAIAMPVQADDRLISVTPSIGIALYPGSAATAAQLIKHADSAMYLAKSRGRANFQFFDPKGQQTAYQALVIESELAEALDREQFVLHYQPQISAGDGRVVGAEALLRWNHPRRGLLLPDQFIHVAEQQRLMVRLGQWVLREAARAARHWQAAGVLPGKIGVNLGSAQFRSVGFIHGVERVLLEEAVDGEMLELELSERTLMDNIAEVREQLTLLKALGLGICVDDFGTGYFSLRHLKELPIDRVKIDRSFVRELPAQEDSAAIVGAIIEMAHALKHKVIAEGVETRAQHEFLAAHGCDEFQGDAICAPLPSSEFEAWLLARRG